MFKRMYGTIDDLHCIVDYEVIDTSVGEKKPSKKELFNRLFDLLITNEKTNIDVKLTYVCIIQ